MRPHRITGIVLAGGKSSRMGADKSLLEYNGKPLIQYAIDALKPVCERIIISANHNIYDFTGCETWPDEVEGNAPMIGIYSCLKRSTTEKNIVHTCDMPLVTSDFLTYLLSRSSGFDITVPSHDNSLIEPLCGIYTRHSMALMADYIHAKNYRLHAFIEESKRCIVNMDEAEGTYPEGMFSNINTMDDLALISSLLRRK